MRCEVGFEEAQVLVYVHYVRPTFVLQWTRLGGKKLKLNFVTLVGKRIVPIKRPPFVGEVSANFCG
jgi:hypothetical protein